MYKADRRFGSIERDDGLPDVFFHVTAFYRAGLQGDPETYCCAVDIGQCNDPTAICVMSKLDGEDPDRDKFYIKALPSQPESQVDGTGYVGSAEWFRDQDDQQKRGVQGAAYRVRSRSRPGCICGAASYAKAMAV
jgi:'Cold-shock' DNA-binding domain